MNFQFQNVMGAPYRGGSLIIHGSELLSPIGNRVSQARAGVAWWRSAVCLQAGPCSRPLCRVITTHARRWAASRAVVMGVMPCVGMCVCVCGGGEGLSVGRCKKDALPGMHAHA